MVEATKLPVFDSILLSQSALAQQDLVLHDRSDCDSSRTWSATTEA